MVDGSILLVNGRSLVARSSRTATFFADLSKEAGSASAADAMTLGERSTRDDSRFDRDDTQAVHTRTTATGRAVEA
jgi:hypothetical protein